MIEVHRFGLFRLGEGLFWRAKRPRQEQRGFAAVFSCAHGPWSLVLVNDEYQMIDRTIR